MPHRNYWLGVTLVLCGSLMGCPSDPPLGDADAARSDAGSRGDSGTGGACDTPGRTEMVSCGMCGTLTRFCTSARVWEAGACEGESGECVPGSSRSAACGMCGTTTERCGETCAWAPGACTDEGECAPGAMGRTTEGCMAGQDRPARCSDACALEPAGECVADCAAPTESVDLLFMVDNSGSMSEEQASLVAELPRLIRALATGDVDGDGAREFAPIGSLHAGVISSDMGTGASEVRTCMMGRFGASLGDDGVLSTRGRVGAAGCSASYPAIFDFAPGTDDPDAFATDLACVAALGTNGCGFERQLEAVLKAVSPSSATSWTADGFVAPSFFGGSSGHALDANAGFLRDESLLAILIVSDEEDCSAADTELFDQDSVRYAGDLNLRCFQHPDALHPVSRFVEGLAQLRRRTTRLVVGSIVGVPLEVEPSSAVPSYDTILAHPRMVEEIDASATRLRASCDTPRGLAFPPRRILTMQRDLEALGAATTTGSICQSSYTQVTTHFLTRIAERLAGDCE